MQPSIRARTPRADDPTYDDTDETARDGVFAVSGESHAGDKFGKFGPNLAHSEERSDLEESVALLRRQLTCTRFSGICIGACKSASVGLIPSRE